MKSLYDEWVHCKAWSYVEIMKILLYVLNDLLMFYDLIHEGFIKVVWKFYFN